MREEIIPLYTKLFRRMQVVRPESAFQVLSWCVLQFGKDPCVVLPLCAANVYSPPMHPRPHPYTTFLLAVAVLALLGTSGCSLLAPLPPATSLEERIAAFPTQNLPLEQPATVRWNEHQVPYIEAATDNDAAFLLGMVHAHLRLAQLEIGKRLSQGRMSELGGPFLEDLDRAMRTIDFGYAVRDMYDAMDPVTRRWLSRFVDGLNHYKKQLSPKGYPHEMGVLAVKDEPWTALDVLTLGRLASIDVNWISYYTLLSIEDPKQRAEVRRYLVDVGLAGAVSFAMEKEGGKEATELILSNAKPGSNSVAVAGNRTESGAALMANDPHLGMLLPNFWLIAGIECPSMHAVGFMPPGLPVFAIGRNEHISWGGTNLRALSSDLVDVSSLPRDAFTMERSELGTRFWADEEFTLRRSPYGPVITDVEVVPSAGGRELALRWMGHRPSEEVSALLAANRATNWEEFRRAFESFAVPAQNMLYADGNGNIGLVLAAHLPLRPDWHASKFILTPEQADESWSTILDALDLPASYNPEEGYLASANNRPTQTIYQIGYFFPPDLRIRRLRELLEAREIHTVESMAALQRDVYSTESHELAQRLAALIDDNAFAEAPRSAALWDTIRTWDGTYDEDSLGAFAFESFLVEFAPQVSESAGKAVVYEELKGSAHLRGFLLRLLDNMDNAAVRDIIAEALARAAAKGNDGTVWGDIHRLEVRHMLAGVPVIGSRYVFGDYPVGGSQETVMKTAHQLSDESHRTSYGSQARHISDLSDPDANYFVLLGGEDGWINSKNFTDQLPLWRSGDYIRMPLTEAGRDAEFTRTLSLQPAK